MNPLGNIIGVDQTVLARAALAAHHRADSRPGAAGFQPVLFHSRSEKFDLLIWNPGDLHCEPRSEDRMPVPVAFGGIGKSAQSIRGHTPVAGDHPRGKAVRSLVVQEPQPLQPLNFFFRYSLCCHRCFLLRLVKQIISLPLVLHALYYNLTKKTNICLNFKCYPKMFHMKQF